MGRKKIQISRITDERNRQVTFNKRKFGVMKKAYELSVLCDCEIALIIFSSSNKLYQYASTDMDKVLLKYTEYNEPHESLTNKNIIEVLTKKENKNGVMSPESPEQDSEYTLTPRTEAKYSKIDEDFQIMMQRNQQLTSGQRVMSSGNYTLPVSVPIQGSYNESGMLQASPQMAHQNISPRPSSSETDSVYPSGSLLEMSNGYPHSTSPLGGSPSPGPSPGIASHHIKHSPGSQSGRNSNLRVVIPNSGMSAPDDNNISYGEHRQQSTLNTPVVALQTPGIPGLSAYPTLGSFGAQDFSMSTSDVMSLTSWNQNLNTVQHTSGLPHLAVSNSTPPPSTSPINVKVKSEPVSPPRDHTSIMGHSHSSSGLSITTMNNATSNISVLSHTPQHMIMTSRPSSTGHLTPTLADLENFGTVDYSENSDSFIHVDYEVDMDWVCDSNEDDESCFVEPEDSSGKNYTIQELLSQLCELESW
ncbi:Myocyte-specific enhancer factor 2 [Pseudolycoriella hygida]|uniref:Myocyte-specific enhancer factor 2 n=1 Tax=Pseudolycoriella hygida TaxID=35572 RepID=A0A9Q0S1X1_9DIPT|nr:Myocyte-specific enhancer factor 2 [Pseudolycoriella hygida]